MKESWHIRNREYLRKYQFEHFTGIYASWYSMKRRCNNKNFHQYKDYGGRGITYEKSWERFDNFKADMGVGYKKGLTLERIDNNGNYSKENCRWATRKEQNNNKRNHILLEWDGKTKKLEEWSREAGIGYGTFRARYYRGMRGDKLFKSDLYRPAKL